MDILYIDNEFEEQVKTVCSEELYDFVINKFAETHNIIRNGRPNRFWVINTFLKEDPELIKEKVKVILAFSFCGAFFEFDSTNNYGGNMEIDPLDLPSMTFGWINVLTYLEKNGFINLNEWVDFIPIANLSKTSPNQSNLYFRLGTMNFIK